MAFAERLFRQQVGRGSSSSRFIILAIAICLVGCEKKPTPIIRAGRPALPDVAMPGEVIAKTVIDENASTENVNEPGSAEEENAKTSPPADAVLRVDDLLKRQGLSDRMIVDLKRIKSMGREAISERTYDLMLSQFDIKTAIQRRRTVLPMPTMAKSETPSLDITYDPESRSRTMREFIEREIEFRNIGVEHFKSREIADLDEEAKTEAAKFIAEVTSGFPYYHRNQRWQELYEGAIELLSANEALKVEPMFLMCLGQVAVRTGRYAEAEMRYERAKQCFRKTEYPARTVIYACSFQNWSQRHLVESRVTARRVADYFIAIEYWLKNDFRAKPDEHEHAYKILFTFINFCAENEEMEILDAFFESFSKQVELPPWLRAITKGRYYDRRGWAHRSGKLDGISSEQGWVKYRKFQEDAATQYQEAHRLNPTSPEAAFGVLRVGRSLGTFGKPDNFWLEQALEARADYIPAIETRLIGLHPSWDGSTEKMLEFAKGMNNKKYDTMLPYSLILCHQLVRSMDTTRTFNAYKQRDFLTNPNVVKEISDVIDQMLEANDEFPTTMFTFRDKNYFISLKAILAKNAGLHEIAKSAFEEVGDSFDQSALKEVTQSNAALSSYRALTYALTGSEKEKAMELQQLTRARSSDENTNKMIALSKELLESDPDRLSKPFYEQILKTTLLQSEYNAEEEIELPFDPDFHFWTMDNISQISADSENKVTVDNTQGDFRFELKSNVQLQGSKIVEYQIELPKIEDTRMGASHFTPSIKLQLSGPDELALGLNRIYRSTKSGQDLANFALGADAAISPKMMFFQTGIQDKNHVRILTSKKYYEVYLNDRFLYRSNSSTVYGTTSGIKFVQPVTRKGRGIAKISNVKVRKWTDQAPPLKSSADELIAFYKRQVSRDSKDKWSRLWLAQALHMDGNYKKAISSYSTSISLGLDESIVGFYLGDCYEQLGRTEEAIPWYFVASDPKSEDLTRPPFSNMYQSPVRNANHWAAMRLFWLKHTATNADIRQKAGEWGFVYPAFPIDHSWADPLLVAIGKAARDEFEGAIESAQQALPNCTPDQEEFILTMIKSFKSNKQFIQPAGDKPFYTTFKQPIPFFESLEDILFRHQSGRHR